MNYEAVTWAMEQRTGCPGMNHLLIILGKYADSEGRCYPSQKRLAQDTDMSESTVRRHLTTLKERGLVSSERRQRLDGTRTSDYLTLNFDYQSNRPVEEETKENSQTDNRSNCTVDNRLPVKLEGSTGQNDGVYRSNCTDLPVKMTGHNRSYNKSENISEKKERRAREAPPDEIDRCKDDWNTLAEQLDLPAIRSLTETRRRAIGARLKDLAAMDAEDWGTFLNRIRGSPWLRGDVSDFRASFDWVTKSANFTKIMDGNYADRTGNQQRKPTGIDADLHALARSTAGQPGSRLRMPEDQNTGGVELDAVAEDW